jgi:hypothetical protein
MKRHEIDESTLYCEFLVHPRQGLLDKMAEHEDKLKKLLYTEGQNNEENYRKIRP